jgi:predicted SAM-dependent methyltransferase
VAAEKHDLRHYGEKQKPDCPRYLNIGAGGFFHPCWHNLDKPSDWYGQSLADNVHLSHDLMSHETFPLKSETLKVAYTSHVIEHLRDNDVQHMFCEVFRCLQSDGFFRITCPDMDLEYEAYRRGDLAFWYWPSPYGAMSIEQRFLEHFASSLTSHHPSELQEKYEDGHIREVFSQLPKEDAFNFFTERVMLDVQKKYPGDHMNWFNSEKITRMLRKAGFENTWDSRYGQSECPLLRETKLFDNTHPEFSLYIECQKSASP